MNKKLTRLPNAQDILAGFSNSLEADYPTIINLVKALNTDPQTAASIAVIEEIRLSLKLNQVNRANKDIANKIEDDDTEPHQESMEDDRKKKAEKRSRNNDQKTQITNFM